MVHTGLAWLFLALVVAGVALLATVAMRLIAGGLAGRTPGRSSAGSGESPRAREILAERYARGEISTDEYRAGLRALEGG